MCVCVCVFKIVIFLVGLKCKNIPLKFGSFLILRHEVSKFRFYSLNLYSIYINSTLIYIFH